MNKLNLFIAMTSNALAGKWYDMTNETERNEAIEAAEQIEESGETVLISDYESDLIKVSNNDTLEELSEFAELLENMSETDQLVFAAMYNNNNNHLYSALSDFEEKSVIHFNEENTIHDYNNDEALGYALVDYGYIEDFNSMPEVMRDYFDYESYGHDERVNGSWNAIKVERNKYIFWS